MKQVLCAFLNIYMLILLARAVLSFFPVRPGTGVANIQHVLAQLTEPIIAPVRRVIPPAGMFDLSFLVVFIAIQIVHTAIGCPGTFL